MSGLFRRLSSRRSAGPEGEEPQAAAEPGATDAPAPTPADQSGHRSLLADPAAGDPRPRSSDRAAGWPGTPSQQPDTAHPGPATSWPKPAAQSVAATSSQEP